MPRVSETVAQATGEFQKTCPECKQVFFTNDGQSVYDALKCYERARNRRAYAKNRATISAKNNARQKTQRAMLEELKDDNDASK